VSSGRNAIVAGTGFEGRGKVIQGHCKIGRKVILKGEPNNSHDANAIAVFLEVPRMGGLFGSSLKQIGYIKKDTAKSLAHKMDDGVSVNGYVKSYYAPDAKDHPRVTLELDH
jgi:hypothetical protein